MTEHFMSGLFSLEDRVAVVTGASRGLGRAMALGLADAGADIVAIATTRESAAGTVAEVEALGRRAVAVGCRQQDPAEVRRATSESIEAHGRVDILVNNAGIIRRAPAEDYSDEDWAAVVDTNLNGVFQFCRGIGRHMLERGRGKIVNVASLLSFSGGIRVPAYSASKGGVMQLTKALANAWANKGVQVNAIAPGYFVTDNTEALRADEARYEEILARIPAGHWGDPSDLQGAVVFLSSAASDYVTGHILVVDGGWMAR